MNKKYQIVYEDDPEESAWGIIGHGIRAYNIEQTGDQEYQRICFVLRTSDEEEIAGGVLGEVYWGWFHLDLLWVKVELRGQGYGQRLLAQAEEAARKQGAKNVYLDTFSFQAPDFYKKYDYRIYGELPDFPPGHKKIFLTKQL